MTELEKLNERIAQLTELIKTESKAIESMKTVLETVEKERDRLEEQQKETEPKFERAKERERYYYVDFDNYSGFKVNYDTEDGHHLDDARYNKNNYFKTKQRAQEVVDKFNFLLELERLHDTYCPDFLPNWKNEHELKYSIFYDNCGKCYRISIFDVNDYKINTFFATKEIAQKVCAILNAELREKERNCNE